MGIFSGTLNPKIHTMESVKYVARNCRESYHRYMLTTPQQRRDTIHAMARAYPNEVTKGPEESMHYAHMIAKGLALLQTVRHDSYETPEACLQDALLGIDLLTAPAYGSAFIANMEDAQTLVRTTCGRYCDEFRESVLSFAKAKLDGYVNTRRIREQCRGKTRVS